MLKPSILAGIMEHFASGLPIIETKNESSTSEDDDDETVQQIKHLLDTRVRPAVAMDGGDITFHSFEDGVVTLQMRGACQGCPSSTATLKWVLKICCAIIFLKCVRFVQQTARTSRQLASEVYFVASSAGHNPYWQ